MTRSYHGSAASARTVVAVAVIAVLFFSLFSSDKDVVGGKGTKKGESSTPCISAFQVRLNNNSIEMDRALSLIQETYPDDYYNSSISHHHFVRTAPLAIREILSGFVWSESTLEQIRAALSEKNKECAARQHHDSTITSTTTSRTLGSNNGGSVVGGTTMVIRDVFDEIYLMRPEFDLVDEKKIHYDGNLKLPGICTIRSLTYLSGRDATLFALSSRKNYTTHSHTSIVLDFDRELHYVSLDNNHQNPAVADDDLPLEDEDSASSIGGGRGRGSDHRIIEPRVMIKSAMHVVLPGTHPLVAFLRITLHRIMLFGARCFRRSFESSQKTPQQQSDAATHYSKLQIAMMAIDNSMRSLNKIHMALPLLLVGLPLGAIVLAPLLFYPFRFFPYIGLITGRCVMFGNNNNNKNERLFVCLLLVYATCALFAVPVAVLSRLLFESFVVRIRLITNGQAAKFRSQNTLFRSQNTLFGTKLFPLLHGSSRAKYFGLVFLHIAWIGICCCIEANAEMVNKILFAPWQEVIYLDDYY